MQVFLQAALDDASRLIPHAQFYPNQGLDSSLARFPHITTKGGLANINLRVVSRLW